MGKASWRRLEAHNNPMILSLLDYVEAFLAPASDVLGWWRAYSREGFRLTAEQLLISAIDFVEANANDLQSSTENGITCVFIRFFHQYGIRASREENSRGHVDILIQHTCIPGLRWCGEAKIWDGASNYVKGLDQVLHYATARFPHCFVLAYMKSGQIQTQMQSLRDYLNANRPHHQQGQCSHHDSIRWALLADHMHDNSGSLVQVLHAGVNLSLKSLPPRRA